MLRFQHRGLRHRGAGALPRRRRAPKGGPEAVESSDTLCLCCQPSWRPRGCRCAAAAADQMRVFRSVQSNARVSGGTSGGAAGNRPTGHWRTRAVFRHLALLVRAPLFDSRRRTSATALSLLACSRVQECRHWHRIMSTPPPARSPPPPDSQQPVACLERKHSQANRSEESMA